MGSPTCSANEKGRILRPDAVSATKDRASLRLAPFSFNVFS